MVSKEPFGKPSVNAEWVPFRIRWNGFHNCICASHDSNKVPLSTQVLDYTVLLLFSHNTFMISILYEIWFVLCTKFLHISHTNYVYSKVFCWFTSLQRTNDRPTFPIFVVWVYYRKRLSQSKHAILLLITKLCIIPFYKLEARGSVHHNSMWIKNPTDATVCRYLFTAKLLYMFWVSQHPSSGVSKTVPAASGTGHTTCTATPLLRGLVWTSCTSRVCDTQNM